MAKKRTVFAVLFLVLVVFATGCGRRDVPDEATPVGLPPDVANGAKQTLSASIGVPAEEIEIVRANQVEWTDTCLELGDEDEFCGQALTPGWRIILRAEGEEHEVHTDLSADTVRLKEE